MNRLVLGATATLLIFCLGTSSAMATIVGIDFNTPGGPHPANWTWGSSAVNNYANMVDETGAATAINLNIVGAMNSLGTGINAATVPNHTNNLVQLSEIIFAAHPASIQLRFTGLTAGTNYSVWVFGLHDGVAVNQNVTIAGLGATNFNQAGASQELMVNDTVGNNAVNLANYAKTVTAAGDGSITITVTSNGVSWALAGLAIEPAPAAASIPTLSEWGIIILSLLLCYFAIRHMKRQPALVD